MHKDKPPGIFEFAARPVGHAVGLGLTIGFLLSVLAHSGLMIRHASVQTNEVPRAGADAAAGMLMSRNNPLKEPSPVKRSVDY